MSPPLLHVRGLSKSYDGKTVLNRVDLTVYIGEVATLAGENGAGKSTLVKILSGSTKPDEGEVEFAGQLIRKFTPADARSLGIAVVHQDFDLAPNMTVAESLSLGREPRRLFGLVDRREELKLARTLLDSVRLNIDARTLVGDLSVAQRQLLALAKCVASKARLLILDEPTSSLSTDDVAQLLEVIREQRAAGTTVLFISHKLDEVFKVSDRIIVFRDGRNVAVRRAPSTDPDEVISLMVGRHLVPRAERPRSTLRPKRLEIQAIRAKGLSADINLDVRQGEVLGLYGLRGSGRTALLRALFGLEKPTGGNVAVDGRTIQLRSPRAAVNAGMAWVCRDRRERGLLPNMSVGENITLTALAKVSRFGLIGGGQEAAATGLHIQRLGIRTTGADQSIMALSGGNQQKVMLARALMCSPRVLILDEPTVGIDVGAKSEIYALIEELVAEGMSILLVSSELPEVLSISDRVGVMREGAIVGTLDRLEATEERVMQLIHSPTIV